MLANCLKAASIDICLQFPYNIHEEVCNFFNLPKGSASDGAEFSFRSIFSYPLRGRQPLDDTVHEMARDEARHGKAFEGLLKRYFGK